MSKPVAFIACLLFATTRGLCAESPRIVDLSHNQVVALINDSVITSMEVLRNMQPNLPQGYALTGRMSLQERTLFRAHLVSLIERSLLVQEAKLKGIEIPEGILDKETKERWEKNYDSFEEFLKALQNMKMTYQDFRNEVENDLLARAMLQTRIQFDYTISPKAMWNYYKENIHEFSESEQRKLKLIQIPLKLQKDEDGMELAKTLARRIKEKTMNFEEAARKHSIGPGADEGGNWGWHDINTGGLNKTIRNAVIKLKKGGISDVIASSGGYFIIKVDDIKVGKVTPFEEAQQSIRRQILEIRYQKERKALMAELRQRAYIHEIPLRL